MAHFMVDLPIKDGDFPVRYVSLPEGMSIKMGYILYIPFLNPIIWISHTIVYIPVY